MDAKGVRTSRVCRHSVVLAPPAGSHVLRLSHRLTGGRKRTHALHVHVQGRATGRKASLQTEGKQAGHTQVPDGVQRGNGHGIGRAFGQAGERVFATRRGHDDRLGLRISR